MPQIIKNGGYVMLNGFSGRNGVFGGSVLEETDIRDEDVYSDEWLESAEAEESAFLAAIQSNAAEWLLKDGVDIFDDPDEWAGQVETDILRQLDRWDDDTRIVSIVTSPTFRPIWV